MAFKVLRRRADGILTSFWITNRLVYPIDAVIKPVYGEIFVYNTLAAAERLVTAFSRENLEIWKVETGRLVHRKYGCPIGDDQESWWALSGKEKRQMYNDYLPAGTCTTPWVRLIGKVIE